MNTMEMCEKCHAYLQKKSKISETTQPKSCIATPLNSRIFKMSFKSSVLLLTFLLMCFLFKTVTSFNVDVKNAKIFTGPSGIYFGYSVAMLRNDYGNW